MTDQLALELTILASSLMVSGAITYAARQTRELTDLIAAVNGVKRAPKKKETKNG